MQKSNKHKTLEFLLDQVVNRIQLFNLDQHAELFAQQLENIRQDFFGELESIMGPADSKQVLKVLARTQLGLIQEIPVIVTSIQNTIQAMSTMNVSGTYITHT